MKRNRLAAFILAVSFAVGGLASPCFEIVVQGATGTLVTMIQNRLLELDYYSFKPTGTYGGMTRSAVVYFQEAHGLSADGRAGEETVELLFSNLAKKNPIPQKVKIPIGPSTKDKPKELGTLSDWSSIVDPTLPVGSTFELRDLNTQKSITVQRTGGLNHAVVEPANKAANAIFLEIFGGSYNFSKRPVMVISGENSFAGSLCGMPSGADSVSGNDMMGGAALYFQNSTSDSFALPDAEHRRTLLRASGAQW